MIDFDLRILLDHLYLHFRQRQRPRELSYGSCRSCVPTQLRGASGDCSRFCQSSRQRHQVYGEVRCESRNAGRRSRIRLPAALFGTRYGHRNPRGQGRLLSTIQPGGGFHYAEVWRTGSVSPSQATGGTDGGGVGVNSQEARDRSSVHGAPGPSLGLDVRPPGSDLEARRPPISKGESGCRG